MMNLMRKNKMPKYMVYVETLECYLVDAEDANEAGEMAVRGDAGDPYDVLDTGKVFVTEDDREMQ
jgi:hypothetical protein